MSTTPLDIGLGAIATGQTVVDDYAEADANAAINRMQGKGDDATFDDLEDMIVDVASTSQMLDVSDPSAYMLRDDDEAGQDGQKACDDFVAGLQEGAEARPRARRAANVPACQKPVNPMLPFDEKLNPLVGCVGQVVVHPKGPTSGKTPFTTQKKGVGHYRRWTCMGCRYEFRTACAEVQVMCKNCKADDEDECKCGAYEKVGLLSQPTSSRSSLKGDSGYRCTSCNQLKKDGCKPDCALARGKQNKKESSGFISRSKKITDSEIATAQIAAETALTKLGPLTPVPPMSKDKKIAKQTTKPTTKQTTKRPAKRPAFASDPDSDDDSDDSEYADSSDSEARYRGDSSDDEEDLEHDDEDGAVLQPASTAAPTDAAADSSTCAPTATTVPTTMPSSDAPTDTEVDAPTDAEVTTTDNSRDAFDDMIKPMLQSEVSKNPQVPAWKIVCVVQRRLKDEELLSADGTLYGLDRDSRMNIMMKLMEEEVGATTDHEETTTEKEAASSSTTPYMRKEPFVPASMQKGAPPRKRTQPDRLLPTYTVPALPHTTKATIGAAQCPRNALCSKAPRHKGNCLLTNGTSTTQSLPIPAKAKNSKAKESTANTMSSIVPPPALVPKNMMVFKGRATLAKGQRYLDFNKACAAALKDEEATSILYHEDKGYYKAYGFNHVNSPATQMCTLYAFKDRFPISATSDEYDSPSVSIGGNAATAKYQCRVCLRLVDKVCWETEEGVNVPKCVDSSGKRLWGCAHKCNKKAQQNIAQLQIECEGCESKFGTPSYLDIGDAMLATGHKFEELVQDGGLSDLVTSESFTINHCMMCKPDTIPELTLIQEDVSDDDSAARLVDDDEADEAKEADETEDEDADETDDEDADDNDDNQEEKGTKRYLESPKLPPPKKKRIKYYVFTVRKGVPGYKKEPGYENQKKFNLVQAPGLTTYYYNYLDPRNPWEEIHDMEVEAFAERKFPTEFESLGDAQEQVSSGILKSGVAVVKEERSKMVFV